MNEQDAIEQLADLLDGSADGADVHASLGALVELAGTVRASATLTAPTDSFRASLRAELLAAADAPPTLVDRTRAALTRQSASLRASTRVMVATATASGMIGSAGVAVAAQEALPGDLLYGIKGATEQARLLLAVDDLTEARLHLLFAAERLEELEATAGELTTEQMLELLDRMDESARRGAEVLIDGAAAGAVDLVELDAFVDRQGRALSGLVDDLPLLVRPAAEDSLELLRRIQISATGVVPSGSSTVATEDDCDCDTPTAQPGPAPAGDEPRADALPTTRSGRDTAIALPGEGPAVPAEECDCVRLPGGSDDREPTTSEEPDGGTTTPEQPPFQDDAPLTEGELEHEDDDEESGAVSGSVSMLPKEDLEERTEDTTGTTVDTSPVDRGAQAVDDLLD